MFTIKILILFTNKWKLKKKTILNDNIVPREMLTANKHQQTNCKVKGTRSEFLV